MTKNISRDRSALYTPVAILIGALIIGVGLYFGLTKQGSGATLAGGEQAPVEVDIANVDISGQPYIGKADAPVVMAYWFDYQCPFCKAFDVGGIPQITTPPAMPDIIKDYVNTGKLKIVFFDYPFLSQDSTDAAEYAHAVWELYPSDWYAWHVAMFKAQDEEHGGFGNAASIDQLIGKQFPKFDRAKLKALIAEKKDEYAAAITSDREQGTASGVNGTPGFVIGKTLISGAQDIAAFKAAIDAEL